MTHGIVTYIIRATHHMTAIVFGLLVQMEQQMTQLVIIQLLVQNAQMISLLVSNN
jgi:hypothetical protein